MSSAAAVAADGRGACASHTAIAAFAGSDKIDAGFFMLLNPEAHPL